MPMSLPELETLLQNAQSVAALDQALVLFLKSYGVTGYSFTYLNVSRDRHSKIVHELVSSNLQSWHQHYHAAHYDLNDPMQVTLNKSLIPHIWDPVVQLHEARNEKEKTIRAETLNLGVNLGLSIPIHASDGAVADLTLRQFKGEHCLDRWESDKYAWQAAALYYFHHLRLNLPLPLVLPEQYGFTAREQQCLSLLLRHCSTVEIAQQLHMKERTVHFHIQNIIHKLGVRNKQEVVQQVYKIMRVGRIKN